MPCFELSSQTMDLGSTRPSSVLGYIPACEKIPNHAWGVCHIIEIVAGRGILQGTVRGNATSRKKSDTIDQNQATKGVFAEKGARFRGKWGLGPPPPPKSPYTRLALPPRPLSWKTPPPPGIFSKAPTAPQEKGGGGGEGPGVGGGGAEAPFTAKTSPLFGENALQSHPATSRTYGKMKEGKSASKQIQSNRGPDRPPRREYPFPFLSVRAMVMPMSSFSKISQFRVQW